MTARTAACLLLFPCFCCAQQEESAAKHARAGAAAMAAKSWDVAEREYRAAMQSAPGVAELASNLGLALYFQKKSEAAARAFEQALSGDAALFVPNLFLGRIRSGQGNATQAVLHFERCARLQPTNVLVHRYLAEALVSGGHEERALSELREAALLAAGDIEVFYSLSKVAMHLAKACMTNAASHPSEGKYYQNLILARHFEQQGSAETARRYYAALPRPSAPDPPLDDASLHRFQARLRAHPEDSYASYWLGRCYERVTLEALARMSEIQPDSHRVHQLRAELAMEQDRPRDAIEDYKRALLRKAADQPLVFGLGQAYMKDGQWQAAIEEFGKVLEQDPTESAALLNAARCYLALREAKRAIEYAARAPQLPAAHGVMGRALLLEERTADAIAELEKAAPSDQDGSVHYQIFLAYRKLRQPLKAQDALRQSQELRSRNKQAYLEEVQIRQGPGLPSLEK